MGMLTALEGNPGSAKVGFLGGAKSGKTHTATLLAAAIRKRFKLKAPIAFFDTEAGAEYVAPLAQQLCDGVAPLAFKGRAFGDLKKVAKECAAGAASVLIVDSITHVWRELCDAYLAQVNTARERRGKSARRRLEFQDWAAIKSEWEPWTNFFLNSPLHIIVCGRQGNIWEFQETEDSVGNEKRELVKVGTKMKVENEFGYEPSLLVEMERVQVEDPKRAGRFLLMQRAIVIGDRTRTMHGQIADNPTAAWFSPFIEALSPNKPNTVDTETQTPIAVDEAGDLEWRRERDARSVICEEIQGELTSAFPGQSASEKKAKVDLLAACLGTRSWTAVEKMESEKLRAGLSQLREKINSQANEKKEE